MVLSDPTRNGRPSAGNRGQASGKDRRIRPPEQEMKVCILTTSFPLKPGDLSGSFVLEQARHLVRLGIDAEVLAPHHPGAPKKETIDGVSVRRFPYLLPESRQSLCYGSGIPDNLRKGIGNKLQLPLLFLMFFVRTLMHARTCDIIHAHWSIAGLSGLAAARILGKPIVLTMHHGSTRMLTSIERLMLKHVDCVLCNSSFTLTQVLADTALKAVRVVPPGVDLERFRTADSDEVKQYRQQAAPQGCPIIFTMGRLIGLKGHAHLIDALRLLPGDQDFRLLIAGDGPLRKELEARAERHGLRGRVTFLGPIPHHLTPVYYSMADVYVQPSVIDTRGNTEGLGMTLLEALACGTPCIGSRVGGIPDTIIDGKTGFLVEPARPDQLAEKILMLLRDKDLRTDMGRDGRRFVEEHFSWEAKAKEHAEIYAGLVR